MYGVLTGVCMCMFVCNPENTSMGVGVKTERLNGPVRTFVEASPPVTRGPFVGRRY